MVATKPVAVTKRQSVVLRDRHEVGRGHIGESSSESTNTDHGPDEYSSRAFAMFSSVVRVGPAGQDRTCQLFEVGFFGRCRPRST